MHASALRVLFKVILVPDDDSALEDNAPPCIIGPLLYNPSHYSHAVKTLIVCEPQNETLIATSRAKHQPVEASLLAQLLQGCLNLEELIWNSPYTPPDGICELLMTHSTRLSRFHHNRGNSVLRQFKGVSTKWDAPSLPLLSYLPITSLHLSQLSQPGARAFSSFLAKLGEVSTLENLALDFIWLDDTLCNQVAESGSRLRKLTLRTSGTKLTDRGIVALLEGCHNLEVFIMDEVHGRLTRSLWTKPTQFPANLRCLRIIINEAGTYHSWMTDHLNSLYAVPFHGLVNLSIIRREATPRLDNAPPTAQPAIDESIPLKPVPSRLVEQLKAAHSLISFHCDFWTWSIADIKSVIEACPKLKSIKFSFDAPFSKLMSMSSTLASLCNLEALLVSVNPIHAPGESPYPLPPISDPNQLPTPKASPVLKSKSVLPQLVDFDQMQNQTCLERHIGDPSMPPLREIRRFVRKFPKLSALEWYGKFGRGLWIITRPPTKSKISINVSVSYHQPKFTEQQWKLVTANNLFEKILDMSHYNLPIERVGQIWVGERADTFAMELAQQSKKEDYILSEKCIGNKQRGLPSKEGASLVVQNPPSVGVNNQSSTYYPHPSLQTCPMTPPHSPTASREPLDTSPNTQSVNSHYKTSRLRSPSDPQNPGGAFEYQGRRNRSTTGALDLSWRSAVTVPDSQTFVTRGRDHSLVTASRRNLNKPSATRVTLAQQGRGKRSSPGMMLSSSSLQ
ncbi:hypothetical protein BD779DRAFT_1512431 [Infundibulicybe gibba]|nr:hypothetical protein BD779DRAFT_1512431 [Infundibulicybe gibba]